MRAFAPSSAISTRRSRKQSGFALVTVAFSIVSLVGAVGLGVDIGRMYIAKNEAQLFADSAALAKAIAPLDTLRMTPPTDSLMPWPALPSVIRSGNLLALYFADSERQIERLRLAITAGAPAQVP